MCDDNTSYSEFVFEIPADRILQVFPPNMLGQQRHWTLTLNLGTKRLNSWCQLLSVDAGEMMRNGPQMLSLCGTQNTEHVSDRPQDVLEEHSERLPATDGSAESTRLPGIGYFGVRGPKHCQFSVT